MRRSVAVLEPASAVACCAPIADPALSDDEAVATAELFRALGDPAWWVRMRSVEALEQIGTRAEGPLLVALDDPDPEIRIRAAVGLERLGVPAALVGMIQRGERLPEAMETLAAVADLKGAWS